MVYLGDTGGALIAISWEAKVNYQVAQCYSDLAPEQLQNAVKLLDGVIGEGRELVGQVT